MLEFMKEAMHFYVQRIALLGLALAAAPGAHATPRWEAEAAVVAGYDSNPLRVQDDGAGSGYLEERIAIGVQGAWGRRAAWMTRLRAAHRSHAAPARDADTTTVGVEAAAAFGMRRVDPTRWVLRCGVRGAANRLTYVDRTTGAPVQALVDPLDPASAISLADRLDHDVATAFVESRWRLGRRVRAAIEIARERIDFTRDYDAYPAVEALDQGAWLVEPHLLIEPFDGLRIDASYAWADRTYDTLTAVGPSGAAVGDAPRRYRQGAGRITVSARTSPAWDLDGGVDRSGRSDRFAGYYDARGWNAWVTGSRALPGRFRARLSWSQGALDYPNARVSAEPDAGYRESAFTRVAARVDRALPRGLAVHLEGGRQKAANADAELAYGRTWIQTGLRWQYEGGRP